MGHAVKKVTSVLTGKSGGGSSKSEEKTNQNTTQNTASKSWLESNPQYQALQNNALKEAANFNMPKYQLAGTNADLQKAIAGLSKGTDTTEYKQAAQYLKSQGVTQQQLGQANLSGAADVLKQFQNMSQSDYQKMVASEYDNDLVQSQISAATEDINQQRDASIQALNQRASTAGAMGSSRAGVAQGVITGKALSAVGTASVQYRTAEEANAANRLQNYLSLRTNTANTMAQIGQAQTQTGLNEYNTGMGYSNQANQIQTQNYQNQMVVGQLQRSMQQQQLDVQRQNQMLAQSPALARLSYYNQVYLPMANLSTTGTAAGTATGTATTNTTTPGTGGSLLGGVMGMAGSAFGSAYGGSMGGQMGGIFGGAIGNSFS